MERTVIALRGPQKAGKTTTIRHAFNLLRQNGEVVHYAVGPREIRASILKINGMLVGIVSVGDLAEDVAEFLEFLRSQGCLVIVCACRSTTTQFQSVTETAVRKLESEYTIRFIDKQRQNDPAEQDHDNETAAAAIVSQVKAALLLAA